MGKPIILSMLGKGGVGKTALSALIGKIFIESGKRTLFLDADPAMGLALVLELDDHKTIGEAREEIIKQARISNSAKEKEMLSDIIDYLLLEALYEGPNFSLMSMGQSETLGCYCPLNSLLRNTIQAIASEYDVIIIDAEAGIEQINRQVVESVDYPIIITDNSMRGIKTSINIDTIIQRVPKMEPVKTGVIFNRVDEAAPELIEKIKADNLLYYGSLRPDPEISKLDLTGKSILEIGTDSISFNDMKKVLANIGILD